MEVFLVAHVSGSLARQVLRGVSCDAHAWHLMCCSTNALIYFKEYSDTEVSHLPFWGVGGDCCDPKGVNDGRGGTLEFRGAAYHSYH
jgi:hypothetical protein